MGQATAVATRQLKTEIADLRCEALHEGITNSMPTNQESPLSQNVKIKLDPAELENFEDISSNQHIGVSSAFLCRNRWDKIAIIPNIGCKGDFEYFGVAPCHFDIVTWSTTSILEMFAPRAVFSDHRRHVLSHFKYWNSLSMNILDTSYMFWGSLISDLGSRAFFENTSTNHGFSMEIHALSASIRKHFDYLRSINLFF